MSSSACYLLADLYLSHSPGSSPSPDTPPDIRGRSRDRKLSGNSDSGEVEGEEGREGGPLSYLDSKVSSWSMSAVTSMISYPTSVSVTLLFPPSLLAVAVSECPSRRSPDLPSRPHPPPPSSPGLLLQRQSQTGPPVHCKGSFNL